MATDIELYQAPWVQGTLARAHVGPISSEIFVDSGRPEFAMHIAQIVPNPLPRKSKEPRKSRRHELRENLIHKITTGKISPGSKLVQTHLAYKFKVSAGVMREALLDLQAHGLVESHDNH